MPTVGMAAITRPAVNASLKVRPVLAGAPAGLVMVKVSVETCPTPIGLVPKALFTDASDCTVIELAVTLLVMRAAEAMLALELVYGPPTTLEVTSTVIAHEACALFIVAPVTTIEPPPAAAATAPVPDGHVVVTFGAAATTTLAGRLSVKPMPACAGLPAPLVSVKVKVDVPPWLMTLGANALFSEAWTTLNVWLTTLLVRTPPTVTLAAAFK